MASIVLDDMVKCFGDLTVVDRISLTIEDGEFFTLLGPSGCGKTTLLRILAGFAVPDSGDVRFGGKSIISTPPHRREIGMVFQNYALFPHMTVADNVAYGLKARNTPNSEIRDRVASVLASVLLDDYADRYPRQLSGGQQQRVALARALVIRPHVLLMDEPLSNLDAKLRVSMREEIRNIQKTFGITTVYVTHDQEEAMAVSDRIAILSGGKLQQVGSPWEVYFHPANAFAAEFMGSCTLLRVEPGADGDTEDQRGGTVTGFIEQTPVTLRIGRAARAPCTIMLRPDWIKVAGPEITENRFSGIVRESAFLGAAILYQVEALGKTMRVDVPAPQTNILKQPGDVIDLYFEADRPAVVAP
ncbi:MAG: ABC transporter ATP-binding protein [Deltaproteobacteria bacterium]|jgi:spermidine/putrescine ABC transporter ATP-binding subunit|nr:ABC transporter ATP-binding protein [Deltaproteobacteria bacterium]